MPELDNSDKVYPRVGGGNGTEIRARRRCEGLSPRGRGKRSIAVETTRVLRSIPAWAGETRPMRRRPMRRRVYPRVGGGNMGANAKVCRMRGLSPRGRGKPPRIVTAGSARRSIPAWAGETAHPESGCSMKEVYPRVGGGNMNGRLDCPALGGLSPRGRGKLPRYRKHIITARSIPAWAGETDCDSGQG